jgi:glyoxylase-like metal-dependent hydrolase (beta-lactamase superfamily II)
MTTLHIGDVSIDRVEELYGPLFPVEVLLPAFNRDAVDNHGEATFAPFMDHDAQMVYASVHSWLVRTPRSTILIDTCTGNHKERPVLPPLHHLDTPFLQRLADAGVQPPDVDYVICTHLHLDHVGWNTSLVDGEWVPTFPNAKHLFNKTEFDFWNPDTNPSQPGLEFNAGVFDDSVRPIFDRGLAQLWDGDLDVDEVFHLAMATGHTAGHHVCWLESKGERALFSGDAMHSPMQVYEPTWNSGFCAQVDEAIATRQQLLETCAERNALLCPAHFAAPHAFRIVPKDNGMTAVPVD